MMNTKIKKSLNLVLRTSIVLATYGFLFYELFVNKKFEELHHRFLQNNLGNISLLLMLILMPVNWGLESLKWQFLIRKVEKIKLATAFKAVFTGTAISFFTPNRVGDFFGRVFILKKGDRIDGIFATIIGNLGQLFVTLILGSMALLVFLPKLNQTYIGLSTFNLILIAVFVLAANVFLVLLFLNIGVLQSFFNRFVFLNRWTFFRHLQILQNYSSRELIRILIISAIRFTVYSLQFYLAYRAFGIELGLLKGLLIVFVLFFTLTSVPTVAIAELGVRGLISVFILRTIGPADFSTLSLESSAVAASSILWLINLAVPAIIGTFFVYELKFFRKND